MAPRPATTAMAHGPNSFNSGETVKLNLELSEDQVAEIVEQVAERVAERHGSPADDRWLRGAEAIAAYIDSKPNRVWKLSGCNPPRIPVEKDGSALIARTSKLDHGSAIRGGKLP